MTKSFKQLLGSSTGDRIVRVVVVLTLILSGFVAYRTQEYARCQYAYNQADQARSEALSGPLGAERQAIRDYVVAGGETLADGVVTPEERQENLDRFFVIVEAYKAGDIARAENPVPPPPDELCG